MEPTSITHCFVVPVKSHSPRGFSPLQETQDNNSILTSPDCQRQHGLRKAGRVKVFLERCSSKNGCAEPCDSEWGWIRCPSPCLKALSDLAEETGRVLRHTVCHRQRRTQDSSQQVTNAEQQFDRKQFAVNTSVTGRRHEDKQD